MTAAPTRTGPSRLEVVVTPDAAAASAHVAELLAAAVEAGAAVALSGGSTPRRAYEQAAELVPDWGGVEVWLADERCVPPGDPRSNLRLVEESVLARLEVAPRLHPVATQLVPEEAAARYDAELRAVGLPQLVLLGLGPDGHTASLFPGMPSLAVDDRLAVASEAGMEPLVPRVSLTLPAIGRAAQVVFLVTGEGKAEVVRRAFAAAPSLEVPASLARSATGATVVVLDRAAAARL